MKKTIFFALLSILAFACNTNTLEIAGTNIPPDGEISEQQNLEFTFSRDMVPDSIINIWNDIEYIVFFPKVSGSFKWISRNTLKFSPYYKFRPHTEYTAIFTKEILKYSSREYIFNFAQIVKFSTEKVRIEEFSTIWKYNSTNNTNILQALIKFSQKINPVILDSLIEFSIDGRTLGKTISSPKIDFINSFTLAIPGNLEVEDKYLNAKIKSGLSIVGTYSKTKKEFSEETKIPKVNDFEITWMKPGEDIRNLTIQVFTNQKIENPDTISKYLKIEPFTDFEILTNEYGFLIYGNFNPENTYEITIAKGLQSESGYSLKGEYRESVAFRNVNPFIGFTENEAMYLTSAGSKNIGIEIYGIPKFKLSVYKIYQGNVLPFTRDYKRWGMHWEEDSEEYYDYKYYETSEYGDLIHEKEYETTTLPKMRGMSVLKLDFRDILKQFDGVYVVKIESEDRTWLQESKIISISDLGIIAKSSENGILVYVNSLLKGYSVQGAQVSLFSQSNRKLATATTNAFGIVKFNSPNINGIQFTPGMISVSKGSDVNYLILKDETKVITSDFDEITGSENEDYSTFLYGDRNLYRPDDTIVVAGIVRDKNWDPLKNVPVKLKVINPMQQVFKEIKINLDEEGGFSTNFYVPSHALTGIYTITASLSTGKPLKSMYVSVEDFLPDRISVEVKTDKENYSPGDTLIFTSEVNNLFGPPASDRNYELEVFYRTTDFRPKSYSNYNFSLVNEGLSLEDFSSRGKTDNQGQIMQLTTIPKRFRNIGIINGTADLTVFDETGRTVSRNAKFKIFTQDVFAGIGNFDRYHKTESPISFPLIAINKNGTTGSGKFRLIIIRFNWETVLRKNNRGNYYFESQKVEEVLINKVVDVNGKKTFYKYTPDRTGSYEVRLSHPDASSYVSNTFYAYGWGSVSSKSFETDKEGRITIEPQKYKYEVGETAKILFKTPFRGKMLITIERDKIIDEHIIETNGKSAELSLKIEKEHLPNIFVSATLIKPLVNKEMPLNVAFGYCSIKTEDTEYKLPVEIIAAKKSNSRTKQKIRVKTKAMKDINVTIAAVDEGILQIKNYNTPNPYDYFYRKQKLGISTFSMYKYLFPEIDFSKDGFGGGAGLMSMLDKRLNPLKAKRVKLLVYWSGILKTDSHGEAEYEIEIPEFSGTVRIMACAFHSKSFGSAESKMIVTDPLVVSTGVPRVLSPGDEFVMPVMISNTTDKTINTRYKLNLTGPLSIIQNPSGSASIPANSEKRIYYRVAAGNELGIAKIVLEASGNGKTYINSTELSVRVPVSLQKESLSGYLTSGNSKEVGAPIQYHPKSVSSKIILSSGPSVKLMEHFEYLINYPHGCLEQTISNAFPQLALMDLWKTSKEAYPAHRNSEIRDNINSVIQKLRSMQSHEGAFTFWPGGGALSWWGSAYAAHFLIEARKQGYNVSPAMMDKLFKYLRKSATNAEEEEIHINNNGKWITEKFIPREAVYSAYVLALNRNPDISLLNHLRSNINKLNDEMKFMLAAAFKLAGDRKNYLSMIPASDITETESEFAGSFSSPVRNLAIAVYTLQEAAPESKRLPALIKHLEEILTGNKYLSTQERSFGLLALAKYYKSNAGQNVSGSVEINGKPVMKLYSNESSKAHSFDNSGLKIKSSGGGKLFYYYQTEGLPKNVSFKEEDNFIRVRRNYYRADGTSISGNSVRQGEVVVVEITLKSQHNETIKNIAITDILPAGLEVENPRINQSQKQYAWIKDQSFPEHFDYRDDRVNIFTSLSSSIGVNKGLKFYYIARAVTKGEYLLGPVHADAMYRGEYHSFHGAGTFTVD